VNKVLKRLVILTLTLAVVSGCGKKGVTVTPEPPPPPAAETVETAPEPVHTFAEPDSFLEVDVDEVVRKAFETVYFEYDQFTLSPAATASLEKAAAAMKEHLNLRVMAEGHADERGTSQYNVGLGESRAQAVRNYLVTYGINGARLELTSYGKERPANPNCDGDDPCHSKNRRVEWRIIGK
jgi:peptidoglycan-associated lipoprotein